MSIQNPIGEPPRDPYKGYQKILDEIDRNEKENKNKLTHSKTAITLNYLLKWIGSILDFLTQKPSATGISLEKNLNELKNFFVILECEDRSLDDGFLSRFSDTWNETLQISSRRKDLPGLWSLIQEIQSYPKNQDYSLGYYLTEHAGKEWAPVPYRELIQKIHQEHALNPENSPLSRWSSQIDQLLRTAT